MNITPKNFFFGEQMTGWLYLFLIKVIVVSIAIYFVYHSISPMQQCIDTYPQTMKEFGKLMTCGAKFTW